MNEDYQDYRAFDGVLIRAGKLVPVEELKPDETWPWPPVLLEMWGHPTPQPGWRRHGQGDYHSLWRLDLESLDWEELGRVLAPGYDWIPCLRPLAVRALQDRPRVSQDSAVRTIR